MVISSKTWVDDNSAGNKQAGMGLQVTLASPWARVSDCASLLPGELHQGWGAWASLLPMSTAFGARSLLPMPRPPPRVPARAGRWQVRGERTAGHQHCVCLGSIPRPLAPGGLPSLHRVLCSPFPREDRGPGNTDRRSEWTPMAGKVTLGA